MDFTPIPSERIHPKAVLYWCFGEAIEIVFTAAALFGAYWIFNGSQWIPQLLVVGGGLVLGAMIGNFFLNPIRWRIWRYQIWENEIETLSGVIFRRRTLLPLRVVQHVDTTQGPLEKLIGLVSLRISTAASEHAIPCLAPQVAADLRQQIIAKAGLEQDQT